MSLVTREEKGSKLTIAEMDGNLTYLESNGFVDGVYSQTVIGTGEIIGTFGTTIRFTNPIDSGTEGTYTVSPTTDGSGTGAQFELVVDESRGAPSINISLSSVLNGGSGYAVGDTLTVDLMDLGGNMGETEVFTLLAGGVTVTKTSTITVTEDEINLSTTTISVTGSIAVTGSIEFSSTSINFSNLPTTDPVVSGQLWNKGGILTISAG
jgi:hypothetical protein